LNPAPKGTPATPHINSPSPVLVWGAQLAGTVAIAIVIYLFLGGRAAVIQGVDPAWTRFGLLGILLASGPALWYVRRYKRTLDADIAAARARGGAPDPQQRRELLRKLSVGGALCELPLALGVIYLLAGGELRYFVAAACVSVALRLSYRPFTGGSR
jgi:hypothetical protein